MSFRDLCEYERKWICLQLYIPPELLQGKACSPQVLVFHQMVEWFLELMDRHAQHIPVRQKERQGHQKTITCY